MTSILLAWIGNTDLAAAKGDPRAGLGPIGQAVTQRSFDAIYLLSDHTTEETKGYASWLRRLGAKALEVVAAPLSSPMHFGEIYERARGLADRVRKEHGSDARLVFHVSPGTPAMAAVWIILAKTRFFPTELIESSAKHGVRTTSVPFDIAADYLPDLLEHSDEELRRRSGEEPPEAPEFSDIVYRCEKMRRLVDRARRVAVRSIPVLIEGESGTGKELFARAIRRASPRRDAPFVAVNCGAIAQELVESELFGYVKGAFTGASQNRKGYFEAAQGGTLFLDEVGELPRAAQVKLLRVLQEGEIVRVGSTTPINVDVRVLAATNRHLLEEVAAGRFREDLFYRLAVAVLVLPPLRERPGDVSLLIEHLLAKVNQEGLEDPGFQRKSLSAGAKNSLMRHPWPGNVRQLANTLRRAALWSRGSEIRTEDIQADMLAASPPAGSDQNPDILGRDLGSELNLPGLISGVARHYLDRALKEAHGNKTKAAQLVGLPSYQTLTNWLTRYGVEPIVERKTESSKASRRRKTT